MSGIGGIISADNAGVEPTVLQKVANSIRHRGPDGGGVWQGDGAGFCNSILRVTPESLREELPLYDKEAKLVLVCDGRIDNRQELIDRIGLHSGSNQCVTDSDIILGAYKKWREGCAEKLIGDFAFAIWDERKRKLFCVRDHMGVKPFYYFWDGRFFAFGSELRAVFSALQKRPPVNRQRILDLLVFFCSDQQSTFYQNIYRLPRASCLVLQNGKLKKTCYWSFDPDKTIILSSDQEYAEAFREVFTEAVRCRLRSVFPVGSTLSGGLDSSSITCVARMLLQESTTELHTFSAIFPGLSHEDFKKVDERQYMDAVISQGGVKPHFIEADRSCPLEFLKQNTYEEPVPAFNMYIHEAMYKKACSEGVRVFLDGIDGDTTVSHGYEYLYDLGVTFRIRKLYKESSDFAAIRGQKIARMDVLKKYVVKPYIPDWLILFFRKLTGGKADLGNPGIAILSDEFKTWCNWEKRVALLVDSVSPRLFARNKHYTDITSLFIQYGMELMDTISRFHKLECRSPFWDRRLMEFCLAIPVEQKLSGGVTRVIFRRAMRGILPSLVCDRNDKANLSPHFTRQLQRNIKLLMKSSLASEEGIARYVNREKIFQTTNDFLRTGATENGALLYCLAALNAWFEIQGLPEAEGWRIT